MCAAVAAYCSFVDVAYPGSVMSLERENRNCVFGTMVKFKVLFLIDEEERPSFNIIQKTGDLNTEIYNRICDNRNFLKLPVHLKNLAQQQLLNYNSCINKLLFVYQNRGMQAGLPLLQKINKILKSMSDIIEYGKDRADQIEINKKGASIALNSINTVLGVAGKIGKTFEAYEGILTAGQLARDVVKDGILDKLKEQIYDQASEQIAESQLKKADDIFAGRVKAALESGDCQ